MDYEFRMKVAERELAHLREMQKLVEAHQDSHDVAITALGGRMERVEASLEATTANLEATSKLVETISVKLAELINALRHGERNGQS